MKTMKTPRSRTWLVLLLVLAHAGLAAQDARKTYTESFDVSRGSSLIVDTRYTDVEILSWDKDVVDILVEVAASSSNNSKAETAVEQIRVELSKEGKNVVVKTGLGDSKGLKNIRLEIDVTIKAPAWMDLDAKLAYGDLFLQECQGLANISVQYGNINAGILSRENQKPYSSMKLSYGNATIDEIGWMEVDIAYSDMEVAVAKMLYVENKYSKIIGEKIKGIVAEGKYDKYYIDEIDSFVADLKYSGLKFGQLNKNLSVSTSYTNIRIKDLSEGFDKVEATLSYGNFYLEVPSSASYKLDAESHYGNISLGESIDGAKLSKVKQNSNTRVWGNVGGSPKAEVMVVTKYGNINIE